MLALRRASVPLRIREFSILLCFQNSELPISSIQKESGIVDPHELTSDRCLSFKGIFKRNHTSSANLCIVKRSLASQAGSDSSGEEDDFEAVEIEDGLVSEPEFSLKTELEGSEQPPERTRRPGLYGAIVDAPGISVRDVLDKWVEEGNALDRYEISGAMFRLRKAQIHGRALRFSKWLEEHKNYEFVEEDYFCRLHLIGKIYGVEKARKYIEKIPESFRGELVYSALLSIYVRSNSVRKAEQVLDEMRSLGLPVTAVTCNQLLLLYKRNSKQKMQDVLSLMERECVKPSILTYSLQIDAKGESKDLAGMERIFESMRTEGIEPDDKTRVLVAKHYASAGLKEKAKAVLKEMEEDDHITRRSLLGIYAELGEADEVRRVWKLCGPDPSTGEYLAAVDAWGRLKNINEAEAVFERMVKSVKRASSVHFISLLKVYVNHKMLAKSKELVELMEDSGCQIGPWTWDLLVKLYIGAGEIERADDTLEGAACGRSWLKPNMSSYMAIMDQYSIRGDVHNAEKMFHRIREAGYAIRYPQFQILIRAYVNAKKPVYGMRDRMRADNFYPDKALADQLVLVDAFKLKKTAA